ncbi:MAG TPA: helix-turn-helix domain-containing protein [Prolixibacteraceae bacterium]|nr:helix-turn-helix domain-containing protein [Prolixibacteraceae bacterium]
MKTLISILIYAGIVQGFYMAFLLNHNKRQNVANKYLAILLSVMSISIVHSVFIIPEIHQTLNDPYRIKEPFLMLVIPLIWLYVKKLEQYDFRFSLSTLLHFIPFVFFMSVHIPAFIHGDDSAWAQSLTSHSTLLNGIIWSVLLVQYSVYLFQIVKITRKVNLSAQQEFSNIEQVDISWLNTFLVAFVLVFIVLAIMFAGAIHHFGTEWMNPLVSVVFAISIFVLGYKGLFQKSIFSNADVSEVAVQNSTQPAKPKTIDASLSSGLQQYMDTHKPYCDPELTLTSLAKMVNMGRNQLSEVINSGLESNFYDFVNKYRVEEVKQLLSHPKFKNYTLLAIALEAGFPSKSTFNTVFKKFTGLTPSEYRNGLL